MIRNVQTLRHRAGVTLVELLLMLVVLTLLGALAVQSLSGTLRSTRLQQSAEQVRIVMTDAKLLAIETGVPVFLRCQLATGNYRVQQAAPTTVGVGGAAAPATAAPAMGSQAVEPQPQGFEGTLEENIVFRSLTSALEGTLPAANRAAISTDGQWSQPIVFMPTGVACDAEIVLAAVEQTDSRERQLAITLRGITCTAKVGEPTSGMAQ